MAGEKRERERQRQRDRQTDRQTEKHKDREPETERASQYVLVLLSSCLQMENKPATTE